jgi:HEAT repeat protein/beta-lactamase regulating signal transducer with metallopeptidase domain
MNPVDPSLVVPALGLLLKSAVLAGAALTVSWFLRRSSAAVRHLWLAAAAVALLALPLASAILPGWNVAPAPGPLLAAPVTDTMEAEPTAEETSAAGAGPARARAAGPSWWIAGLGWFVLVWWAGAALLLVRLIGGKLYAYRIAAKAPPVEDAGILDAVRRISERLDLAARVPVVESGHLDVPFVCGLIRSRLIVPPGFEEWPADRIEAVLRHELGHVGRRDVLVQFLAQAACCLYWVNPLCWILERRLLVERERACDDIALGRETKGSDYAEHLMAVAEELGAARNRVWVVSAMAEGTDFKDRILSILDPGARRTAPGLRHSVLALLGTGLLLLPLSAIHPVSEAARTHSAHPEVAADTDLETLIASLSVSDAEVREHAASALGRSGDPAAVPALIEALGDGDPDVREHVASALGRLGDPAAVPALVEALGDRDPDVREHVASALGRLGDPAAVPALAEVVAADPEPRVREHAASALGKLGPNDDAYDALVDAYETDASVRVRAHAAFGLGLLGDPRAFDLLVEGLDSPHADIRRECAEGLGWLGDPRAVPYLEPLLESSDARIRERTQKALQMLSGR